MKAWQNVQNPTSPSSHEVNWGGCAKKRRGDISKNVCHASDVTRESWAPDSGVMECLTPELVAERFGKDTRAVAQCNVD